MITIDWLTRTILVPQSFCTYVSPNLYELDVNAFRLALKDLEDDPEGMTYPDTHRHNTEVVLSGVTYARSVEIINGYTVGFEDVGSHYTVRCVGANHNLADVLNFNSVNLIIGNSAGLQVVSVGSGLSPEQSEMLLSLAKIHGLVTGTPLVVSPTSRVAGDVDQAISTVGDTTTVTRT
jgi:hypothetical protein